MNRNLHKKVSIKKTDSIRHVLQLFEKTAVFTGGRGFAFVLDDNDKLVAIVTDGDIRRYLLSGGLISDGVIKAGNLAFISVDASASPHEVLRNFDLGIKILPVIDSLGYIIGTHQYNESSHKYYSKPKIYRVKIPLRVSFSGGGTDMSALMNESDTAVICASINRYCYASILLREDSEIHILSKDLNMQYHAKSIKDVKYDGNLDLLKAPINLIRPKFGFNLETFSQAQPGTGLGGSSALTAAVIGVLNSLAIEYQLDLYGIADLAYQSERVELGMSGGWQDQYATIFGGFNWIEFRKKEVLVHPMRLMPAVIRELEYNLMFFRVGNTRNSADIQKQFADKSNGGNELGNSYFVEMKEVSLRMKESLLRGSLKAFGDLLDRAWQLKKRMNSGVTNELIEECYFRARKSGALGGKVLGAGQSGYLMLFASPLYHKKITIEMSQMGCFQEHMEFTEKGLEFWTTDR